MQNQPTNMRDPVDADSEDRQLERRVVRPTATSDVEIQADGDGQPRIRVPISSTSEHRSGGQMTERALESMADQLDEGRVGLWDDHGLDETGFHAYRREDLYGGWVGGEVNDGVLWAEARLREDHEPTADLVDQLDQELPVGFSIGYHVVDEEIVDREPEGERGDTEKLRLINEVDLLECSPVGIPDNRDAYAAGDDPGEIVARSLAHAGYLDGQDADEVGPELGDRIAEVLSHSMTDTDTESADEPDEQHGEGADEAPDPEAAEADDDVDEGGDTEPDTEPNADPEADEADPEQNAGDGDSIEARQGTEETASAIVGIFQDHFEAAAQEAQEWVEANAGDGDGEGEDEDEEEAEEEDSASTGPEKDEGTQDRSATEALEERISELEERLEEKSAEVDRLKSETRETEGRKGRAGITPVGEAASSEETAGTDGSGQSERPGNALEEAYLLTEDN